MEDSSSGKRKHPSGEDTEAPLVAEHGNGGVPSHDNGESDLTKSEEEAVALHNTENLPAVLVMQNSQSTDQQGREGSEKSSGVGDDSSNGSKSAQEFWKNKEKQLKILRYQTLTDSLETAGNSFEAANNFLAEARKTPYLTEYAKKILERLEEHQLSLTEHGSSVSHSDTDRKFDADKVYKTRMNLFPDHTEFIEYVGRVIEATTRVTTELRALSGLSEAEGTTSSLGTGTRDAADAANQSRACDGDLVRPVASQDNYKRIFAERDTSLNAVLSLQTPTDDSFLNDRLKFVSEVLEDYLQSATFFVNGTNGGITAESFKESIRKVTATVFEETAASLDNGNLESSETVKTILGKLKEEERTAPGTNVHEVKGTQPWLALVVRLVGLCIYPPYSEVKSKSETPSISPVKTRLTKERLIMQTADRAKRSCDIMLGKDGRYSIVTHDDDLSIIGEEKPGYRGSLGPLRLLQQAQDQVISACAKSVWLGFNFAGPGVPTHATGFVATVAGIRVMQLRLKNVGTPNVRLVLLESDLLPLLSPKLYDLWAATADKKREKDFMEFRKQLYGTAQEDNGGIPFGINALCALMQKRRKDLFGPSIDATGEGLGDVLGSGSFSVVFRSSNNPNQAIKLSRYGRSRHISHEANILRVLCSDKKKPRSIPFLDKETRITAMFGDVQKSLPAIITSPVGMSVIMAYCKHDDSAKKISLLQRVLKDIQGALKFMHKKGIYHLDVNPKNIVVSKDSHAVLIDYSVSWHDIDKQHCPKGFVGTVNYTHREIFSRYPNTKFSPRGEHDMASLGFTMAMLANDCRIPWASIVDYPKTIKKENEEDLNSEMNARLCSARKSVYITLSGNKLKDQVLQLLNQDEKDIIALKPAAS